jgi:neutral ceramidase
MMERYMDPDYLASQGPFVAAFASTNLGDISPNILVSVSTT